MHPLETGGAAQGGHLALQVADLRVLDALAQVIDLAVQLGHPLLERVMALALNGTIEAAVPLPMEDGWGPRRGETTLGAGAPVVALDVVTGRLRIEAPAAR